MKIKLALGSLDKRYTDCFLSIITEKYEDVFEISICSNGESLRKMSKVHRFDVVLVEVDFLEELLEVDATVRLILFDNFESPREDKIYSYNEVYKYQRVSSIVEDVLCSCGNIKGSFNLYKENESQITAVWSPCGGVGKTSVALAYATRKALSNKDVLYLNLEKFSSEGVYFEDKGQSVSNVFQKIGENLDLVIKGAKKIDSVSGVGYFCSPENYDDMNQLSSQDIEDVVKACAKNAKEVVIDLSSDYNFMAEKAFELANRVFVICDTSKSSYVKTKQFMSQHSVWESIRKKSVVIGNKGAKLDGFDVEKIKLPLVKSADDINVYKTLSAENFER